MNFAEQLARFASELNQARVETHFDLLSGEYYSADLLNHETSILASSHKTSHSGARLVPQRTVGSRFGLIRDSTARSGH